MQNAMGRAGLSSARRLAATRSKLRRSRTSSVSVGVRVEELMRQQGFSACWKCTVWGT